jgi:REP element-mobilizing transposase RayT
MLAINGMPDHIHIFIDYSPRISIPDLIKDIKLASGQWLSNSSLLPGKFRWQDGYGAFSYSKSQIHNVCLYIENQEKHHKTRSFKEEYKALLKAFGIAFQEKNLFEFLD